MTKERALSIIEHLMIFSSNKEAEDGLTELHRYVKEQPEIVRCKDCIHRKGEYGECKLLERRVTTAFFCGRGKRG